MDAEHQEPIALKEDGHISPGSGMAQVKSFVVYVIVAIALNHCIILEKEVHLPLQACVGFPLELEAQ